MSEKLCKRKLVVTNTGSPGALQHCSAYALAATAIEHCKLVVHVSFRQHAYLCDSEKLTDDERRYCTKWCSGDTYMKMDLSCALEELAIFLYQHFERDVVFLVDDYDSLFAKILFEADGFLGDVCKELGVDHRAARVFLSDYYNWMEQIIRVHHITPVLVGTLINASQRRRDNICIMNGVGVNVAQQLVDEYEQLLSISNLSYDNAWALIRAHENEIEKIWTKPLGMIAPLLKTSNTSIHLLRSLVTAVSYIAGTGWAGPINNISPSRFTEYHQFNQFYGFQSKEIEGLLEKLGKSPGFEVEKTKALDTIKAQYSGYEYPVHPYSEGNPSEKMYCPWSVLNYIREGTSSLWAGVAHTEPLKHMFQNANVRWFLLNLLEENGKAVLYNMNKLTTDDLVNLKKCMQGISTHGPDQPFLNFMLDLGYLTAESDGLLSTYCWIPNVEVKLMILQSLKDYYKEKCSREFKENAFMKSEEMLNCINSAADPDVSDEECKRTLRGFRQELQTLFQQYSDSCLPILHEAGLHCFMAEIITAGNFRYFTEHYALGTDSNKDRLDVLGFGKQFAFLVEFKHFPTSEKTAVDALNQVLDKEYFNAFEHPTLLASNLKCHLLMGICVNEDKKIAISAIRNHKKGTDSHRINIPFDE